MFESSERPPITQATQSDEAGVLRLSVNRSVAGEPLIAMATIDMEAIEKMVNHSYPGVINYYS